MNVTTIEVDKETAVQKYKEYLEANKKRASKEYSAARRAYRALSKGLKVIDIYQAFEKTGKKADDTPKLAIVRADSKEVYFTKEASGGGVFRRNNPTDWSTRNSTIDTVRLPVGTFKDWEGELSQPNNPQSWVRIKDKELVTNVPFIPAHITVPGKLENYYILFEVNQWKTTAKVKDPYLLQRLNANTFVVLAEWDVTDVEAIIMRGA